MNKKMENKLVPKLRFGEFKASGEWDDKSIGDFAKVTAGGTPDSTNANYWNGDIPWMNSGELNLKRVYAVLNKITHLGLKESSTRIIPKNCVLIGLAGQGKTRGTAAINYIELCTNQSIASIHPNPLSFNSEFLYHKIDSIYDELRLLSTGEGGRGGLNLQIIKSLKIALPNLKEQQKIADCFSSLDDLITAENEKLDSLKNHKKGLMQQLFPTNGQKAPKLRFSDFKDSGDWVDSIVGSTYDFKTTNSLSRENLNYASGLVKNIHYGDIHTKFSHLFDIKSEKVPYINSEISISKIRQESYCQEGDMIFADASEDLNDIGKSIEIINLNSEKLVSGLHTFLARQKDKKISLGFGAYLFKSSWIRRQIQREAQGTKVLSISTRRLSNVKILYSKNLKEQQKIVDCLSSLEEQILTQAQKIENLKFHKKGLMQQLFPTIN